MSVLLRDTKQQNVMITGSVTPSFSLVSWSGFTTDESFHSIPMSWTATEWKKKCPSDLQVSDPHWTLKYGSLKKPNTFSFVNFLLQMLFICADTNPDDSAGRLEAGKHVWKQLPNIAPRPAEAFQHDNSFLVVLVIKTIWEAAWRGDRTVTRSFATDLPG